MTWEMTVAERVASFSKHAIPERMPVIACLDRLPPSVCAETGLGQITALTIQTDLASASLHKSEQRLLGLTGCATVCAIQTDGIAVT